MLPVPDPIDPVDLITDLSPKQFGPYKATFDRESDMDIWHSLKRRCFDPVWMIEVLEARVVLDSETAHEFASEFGVIPVRFRYRINNGDPQEALVEVSAPCITGLTPIAP